MYYYTRVLKSNPQDSRTDSVVRSWLAFKVLTDVFMTLVFVLVCLLAYSTGVVFVVQLDLSPSNRESLAKC